MPSSGERLRADLSLLLVAVIWGGAFVAQRVAGLQGGVFLFTGLRFLIGALVLLPFGLAAFRAGREFWRWSVLAGAVLFIAAALQQAGLCWTTAGNAGFLTSLYVVIVPLLMWLGWRQRPSWLIVLAVPLSALGAFLLSGSQGFRVRPGDLLELAGALFWAVHVVLISTFAARFDPLQFSLGQFLVCAMLNLLAGVWSAEPMFADYRILVVPALYTGIFSVGLGYTLQVWAQRHTPPTDAALILSLEAVFAAGFGWWLLSEGLDPAQVAGAGLILAAVALVQFRRPDTEGTVTS